MSPNQEICPNCHDVRCMQCHGRAPHDACADDCPKCCAPDLSNRIMPDTKHFEIVHWTVTLDGTTILDAKVTGRDIAAAIEEARALTDRTGALVRMYVEEAGKSWEV